MAPAGPERLNIERGPAEQKTRSLAYDAQNGGIVFAYGEPDGIAAPRIDSDQVTRLYLLALQERFGQVRKHEILGQGASNPEVSRLRQIHELAGAAKSAVMGPFEEVSGGKVSRIIGIDIPSQAAVAVRVVEGSAVHG